MPKWTGWVALGFTLVSCATAHVKVSYEEEEPEHARARVAFELASQLGLALPAIVESFAAGRRRLLDEATQTYPAAGVRALLDSTESALQAQLALPELAPMRDKVSAVFLAARQDLGIANPEVGQRAGRSGVALAAFTAEPSSATKQLSRGKADPGLDKVLDFLRQMLGFALKRDNVLDLCIVSRPRTGEIFAMSAPSYPDKVYQRRTAGKLINVYRGMYAYIMTGTDCPPKPGQKLPSCVPIDLWSFSRPTLDCDLNRVNCSLSEGWPPACESSGR